MLGKVKAYLDLKGPESNALLTFGDALVPPKEEKEKEKGSMKIT